jgi:predicted membrane channel-forming protein YqfA (hemolysin III family)
MKKARITYAVLSAMLLLTEILIGLYVHDNFVRPYIGDVLVTVLLCCLCRSFIPKGFPALPVCVFVFAAMVEVAQYLNIVRILGWENNPLLSTIVGTSFSFLDILCYGVGCIIFRLIENLARKKAN